MAPRKPPNTYRGSVDLNQPWYTLKGNELGAQVQALVEGYKTQQSGRRTRYVKNLELFEGRRLLGYSAHTYYEDAYSDAPFENDRLRLLRSACATAVSTIFAPQKPKPQFQTSGATWATRRRAYRLDRVCEGILHQRQGRWVSMWPLMIDAAMEMCIQGTAALWVQADLDAGRISHDLVPVCDIFTDPAEGRQPKTLIFRRPLDQATALELFPGHSAAIRGAKPYEWYGGGKSERPRTAKVIEVVYAYRLPSPKQQGKWAAVIGGETVDSGEWSAPAFPFVFLQWEPHRDGFWASGIIDEGTDLARECGELSLRLLHREIIASNQFIFYEQGMVKPDDLAMNDARIVVPYLGTSPPVIQDVVGFNPIELQFLQDKVRAFWDAIGISQVSAAARREQGVDSGVAMRTLNDTKAGRQLLKAQRYEQAFVDLAHQWVWRLRELGAEDKNFSVNWAGKSLIRSLKWKDCDVDDEMFSISVDPASNLPNDPAGRQQMIQDMYNAKLISQETAKNLMGWPDLDAELNVENAESEYIDGLIEKYLDADQSEWGVGDYQAPEGFIQNKVGALKRFTSAWFRLRIDQASLPSVKEQLKAEFNAALLKRYIQELEALIPPPPGPTPDQLPPPQQQAA